jgi:hypothetical protein
VAVAFLLLGLCSAGAQAGGSGVGFAVVLPLAPMAPVAVPVAVAPTAAAAIVPVSPVFVSPVFVPPVFAPPVFVPPVFVAPVVPVPPVVPAFGGLIVQPTYAPGPFPWTATGFAPPQPVPAFAPPLFFAPPAGGPIIVIPGSGF